MYYFYVKISRNDRVIAAIIKYDQAVKINNFLYAPNNTMQIHDLENNLELLDMPFNLILASQDNLELKIQCGDTIEIGLYNPITENNHLIKTGFICEISYENTRVHIMAKGNLELLNTKLELQYNTNCNNRFADKNCCLTKQDYIFDQIILLSVDNNKLEIDIKELQGKVEHLGADFFQNTIQNAMILSQDNEIIAHIQAQDGNWLSVFYVINNLELQQQHSIKILFQCDKSFTSCRKYFCNHKNFCGQPMLDNYESK